MIDCKLGLYNKAFIKSESLYDEEENPFEVLEVVETFRDRDPQQDDEEYGGLDELDEEDIVYLEDDLSDEDSIGSDDDSIIPS